MKIMHIHPRCGAWHVHLEAEPEVLLTVDADGRISVDCNAPCAFCSTKYGDIHLPEVASHAAVPLLDEHSSR